MKKRIIWILILIVGVIAFAIPGLDDDGLFALSSLYEVGKEEAPELTEIRANAVPVDFSLSSSTTTSDSIEVEFVEVVRDFIEDTTSISYKTLDGTHLDEFQNLPHGIVVDPEGKMWVGFYGNCSREFECQDGRIIDLLALHCFMPDGSPAFFSPMEFFEFPDSTRDTIYYESRTTGSCRGLSAMDDGDILFTSWSTVIKIDYRNGHGLAEWNPAMNGFECSSMTEAAHDPDEGLIYVGHVIDQKPVYMLDEDLNYLGIAIDTVPTLHRSILARTKSDGISQIFSGSIYDGLGIFVYESSDPRTQAFQLVDTLANEIVITPTQRINYLAWPSCLDWYDKNEGILLYGNLYEALAVTDAGDKFIGKHASRWTFLDVDNNRQLGSFGIKAPRGSTFYGPYGEDYPGGSFSPRGASFVGDYIYTMDFNLHLLQKWQIMDFADTLMLTMTVSDSTDSTVLTYGWTTESTDDFDDGLDEYDTLIASDGMFDAHFNNTLVTDMRAPNFRESIDWNFDFRNGEGNGPIVITWDNTAFPNYGYFFLRDTVDGSLVNINMRDTSIYVAGEFDPPNLKLMYFYKMKAEFSADIQSGKAPLAVSFSNRSVGVIRNWSWSFGDGGVSREKNPVHVYTEPGVYEVRLIINDGQTTDEIVKTDYVHVSYGDRPGILNVRDVPDDQGGWVLVNFRRSGYDTARPGTEDSSSSGLEMYSVEISDDGINWITANSTVAYGADQYRILVHTLYDSCALSNRLLNFRVVAGMTEGNYISGIWTGYSVDNIAPPAPTGLQAEYLPSGVFITWDAVEANDIKEYRIYRCSLTDVHSPALYATTSDNSFTDIWIDNNSFYYYSICAVDVHDNVGPLCDVTMVEVDVDAIPDDFELAQNYPNPFNPTTTLTYGLPEASDVSIVIYDIQGKKVMEWNVENQNAGWHNVIWNGTNAHGSQVSTGMYIYSLRAGDFSDTKKMILMK